MNTGLERLKDIGHQLGRTYNSYPRPQAVTQLCAVTARAPYSTLGQILGTCGRFRLLIKSEVQDTWSVSDLDFTGVSSSKVP